MAEYLEDFEGDAEIGPQAKLIYMILACRGRDLVSARELPKIASWASVSLDVLNAAVKELNPYVWDARGKAPGTELELLVARRLQDGWIVIVDEPVFVPSSFVYFIQEGEEGAIKIGTSHSPRERLKQLQTGNSESLMIAGVVPGDVTTEFEIHARFSALRLRGEWYRPEPELINFIKEYGKGAWNEVP